MNPYRSEDIAPLLAAPGPDATAIRGAKGTVVSWNPLTGANTIRFRGVLLTDVPIVASSGEVLAMKPGDEVVLHIFGTGGFSTVYIMGRVTKPGTPQAASFMDLFGLETASEATEGNALTLWNVSGLGDLQSPANPGPAVTVTVGRSGRVLVLISAEIISSRGTVGFTGGQVGVTLSGANTLAANDQIGLAFTKYHVTADAGAIESWLYGTPHVYRNLNPGETTFKLRYGTASSTCNTAVKNRLIAALPL